MQNNSVYKYEYYLGHYDLLFMLHRIFFENLKILLLSRWAISGPLGL